MLNIGLTYDLRSEYIKEGYSYDETAEFDRDDTIEAIENTLQELGYATDCIGHVRDLAARLVKGDRWDLVFNIAEGMYGIAREAQVPALLDAYKIPYVFSDGLVLALTLHKGMCKHVVRDCGLATPDFFVVNNPSDIDKINLSYPLFAKPVAEGSGKGVSTNSKIENKTQLKEVCLNLLEEHKQPVLVETFLPGREFTVGIIGTGDDSRVVGLMEVVYKNNAEGGDIYSLNNKNNYEKVIEYVVPEKEITEKCYELSLNVWKCLDCRDGGRIDIRLDENGIPNFIEVNPLAGLNPTHSDLPWLGRFFNVSYKQLIEGIMTSALKRIGK